MRAEPELKGCIAYFDGQNLFHSAKGLFGYSWPNYDPMALASHCSDEAGWQLQQVRFYSGIPRIEYDLRWHRFWQMKTARMGRQGIKCMTLPLRYTETEIELNGVVQRVVTPREKGIDIRIALDVIRGALDQSYDIALVFSQEQDYAEVAQEVRAISLEQDRWLKIASAFPVSPPVRSRGIDGTDWKTLSREVYDACLDEFDYLSHMPV